MSRKRISFTALVISLLLFIFILSGCDLGFGIKLSTGIGKLYFDSYDPLIYGDVYVDSIHIGYLEPYGRVSTFVALDFDHEVWVQCGHGIEYRWKFRAPFFASEIIPLTLETIIEDNP